MTLTGTLTNTGTITGAVGNAATLVAISNNSPGAITLGGGTNTITGALANASLVQHLQSAGATTFSRRGRNSN
jgi:hypothetical protein